MYGPLLRGKHEHGRRSLLFWCLLWSVSLVVGLGVGRILASTFSVRASEVASPALPPEGETPGGAVGPLTGSSPPEKAKALKPRNTGKQRSKRGTASASIAESLTTNVEAPVDGHAGTEAKPSGGVSEGEPAEASKAAATRPMEEAAPSEVAPSKVFPKTGQTEIAAFLKREAASQTENSPFSLLEIAGEGMEMGVTLAAHFPESTWVVAGGQQAEVHSLGGKRALNLIQVQSLTLKNIKRMHIAPQIFEFLLLPNFVEDFLDGNRNEELGLLLSMARTTVVYVSPDSYLDSIMKSNIKKAGKLLVDVADSKQIGVLVQNVQGNIIRVRSTMISRPVQHHFGDFRPSSEGGTCYKYKLFHKPSSEARTHPWLCQIAADASLKGPNAPASLEQCPVDPDCGDRTIELKNSNWVNVKLLAGLGLSEWDKERMIRMYLELPVFKDCPTWNVCVAGSRMVWCDSDAKDLRNQGPTMSKFINKGCARLDVGMKYEAKPSCCLDLLLTTLDSHHCGLSEEETMSLNIGHKFNLEQATACRRQYFGSSFNAIYFQDSFIDDAQESFVFGDAREPSRMTKEEIETELKERGLSAVVTKSSGAVGGGNAKEQLIQRLEQARMETSTLSHAQLVSQLQWLHLSTSGSQEELAKRLSTARQLAYRRVKAKLFRGRIKNRIETLRKGVEGLSKEELRGYLKDAGLGTNGEKGQLVARLNGAWKQNPELKEKAIAALERQLEYGDSLFDVKMAEQEEKDWARRAAASGSAPHKGSTRNAAPTQVMWDAGSIEDLGEFTGLGPPSLKSMSKKELQDEAKSAGLRTGGTKEELQKLLEKSRRGAGGRPTLSSGQQRPGSQPGEFPMGAGQRSQQHRRASSRGHGGPYDASVDYLAEALVKKAVNQGAMHSSGPERMSRQELLNALAAKGVDTSGSLSKEKLIEMAKREGIQREGTHQHGDDTRGISRLVERGFGGPDPGRLGRGSSGRRAEVGGQSLRERLMAREATLNGWTSTGEEGSFGRRRRHEGWRSMERGRGPVDVVERNRAVTDMSRSELEAVLRETGTPMGPGRLTKERMQELVLARMTKDEMIAQCRLLGLDTGGTKVELKARILASKATRRSAPRTAMDST